MILKVMGSSLYARVDISPDRARQFLAAIAMLPEMTTPLGPPAKMIWHESSPSFYEDEECETFVRTDCGMLHIDSTSVFWSAYVKHSENHLLETECVEAETLEGIANGDSSV